MNSFLNFFAKGVGVAALCICFCVAWIGFLAVENSWRVFWTISRPHYKLSFKIQMPDGIHSAQTVVEITYFEMPGWETIPFVDFSPNFRSGTNFAGHAAAMRLPDGKAVILFARFGGGFDDAPHAAIETIADRLLTTDPEIPFARSDGVWPDNKIIDANTGDFVSGGADIPLDMMPPMIVLTDASNIHTAHVFDPRDPERFLGPGARFLGARIEVTKQTVGSDILSVLPWLDPPGLRTAHPFNLALDGPLTTRDDPFATETHGRNMSRADF
jgi:hypothetical protein